MSDNKLGYNCRLALSMDDAKTSYQIGLAYSPETTIMYEKLPDPKIPIIRMPPSYKPGTIYARSEDLKTTYNETFQVPIAEESLNFLPSRLLKYHDENLKSDRLVRPMGFGLSEYKAEYPTKWLLPSNKEVCIEQTTTCPIENAGRDEREPLPLTQNYNKYLDIYLSTTRLAHRAFTHQEQTGIAMKNIVTSQETMDIPKGRGFGCKYPSYPGQDLDNRERKMIDKIPFQTEIKPRYIPKGMPQVPNFGCESETQASYTKPEGTAVSKIFVKFAEYPQPIVPPTTKQALCPPGMYTTESSAIHNHTSPQTVV